MGQSGIDKQEDASVQNVEDAANTSATSPSVGDVLEAQHIAYGRNGIMGLFDS